VDWSAGAVRLLAEAVPWAAGEGRPRRAGVSAFGISGTNAHAIIEEAPAGGPSEPVPGSGPSPAGWAWLLSARSGAALAAQAARLHDFLAARPDLAPADVAWSLATTRSVFDHRAVITGSDRDELTAALSALATGEPAASLAAGVVPVAGPGKTVFVFPGQGSQWAGMGRELAEVSPVFAARLAECGQALAPYVDWSLEEVLAGADGAPGLEAASVVQPVLWAIMVSLAATWQAAGVTPDAVVGHSQGEIAAACVAGILSLEDAAKVVALRSRALSVLAGHGGMLSVAGPAAVVADRIGAFGERVSVAAVNGPAATVVAGEPAALEELAAQCAAAGVRTRMIAVDYASHTGQVEAIRGEILGALAGIAPQAAQIPMVSAMTGQPVDGPGLDAGYWYDSLRAPVQFTSALDTLAEDGHGAFLEISPHPVLTAAITSTLDELDVPVLATGTLRRDDGGLVRLLASLGEAHVHGVAVDWAAVLPAGRRIGLPTYAFQHQRYWPQPAPASAGSSPGWAAVGHPLLATGMKLAGRGGLVFTGRLSVTAQPWLADHAVQGTVLLPGTAFVEMAVLAGDQAGCGRLEELTMEAPLILPAGPAMQVQVLVGDPDEYGLRSVDIHSRAEESGPQTPWTRHASGVLAPVPPAGPDGPDLDDFQVWPPEGANPLAIGDFYGQLASGGYQFGPVFRGLRAAWRRGGDLFAEVSLPEESATAAQAFGVHPALLDSALHPSLLDAAGQDPEPAGPPSGDHEIRLPFAWTGVSLHADGATALRARLRHGARGLSLTATDTTGSLVVSVESLVSRPIPAGHLATAGHHSDSLFTVSWVPVPGRPAGGQPGRRWAVLGPDIPGLAAGTDVYADVAGLVAAAGEDGPVPDEIVVRAGPVPGDPADPAEAAHVATARLLATIQKWLAEERLASSRLVVVTQQALAVRPGEPVTDLAGAAAWGLARSAQSENPGRMILADLPAGEVTAAVLREAAQAGEPELAVREGTLYARRLARAGRAAEPGTRPPRETGTVLITGGTGTLGGLVARHLAASGRAGEVILVSRSGPGAPGAAGLAAAVAAAGAGVQVTACDSAERAALSGLLQRIPATAPLTMVVHAAGVLDDGVTGSLTAERVDTVMRPKADAAWHLHALTQDRDLQAFVLFSSAAATFGSAGQGNYAAANAFLDGLAGHRRAQGLPATSLAWGLWADTSAMTGRLGDVERARITRGGVTGMTAGQGLALLDLALDRDEAVLVPVQLDVGGLRSAAAAPGEPGVPALLRDLAGTPPRPPAPGMAAEAGEPLRQRLGKLPGAERDRALVDLVRAQAAAVLGHASPEAVEAGRPFKDLGFDSLTAVDLRNRLSAVTGLRLPATLVFDHPTPAALAADLRTRVLPDTGRDGPDRDESTLRKVLASVPLSRFRDAGLMDALLELAEFRDGPFGAGQENAESIETMGAEDLIRMAMHSDETDFG
ncbi:MAG TPA: type I polyketide synthase, partial [Streptosporangiaceae bacterium]